MGNSFNPLIPCRKCIGKGKVPMSDELYATLCIVKTCETATASEVIDRMTEAVEHSAVNNRLEYLRELGFLKRVRNGKTWIYSPAKKKS